MASREEYALLLGRYCGYRWASECTKEQQQFFERHNETVNSFDELCTRLTPCYPQDKGVTDNYAVRDSLYLKYARGMPPAMEDLDQLPDFLAGFCHDADLAFERKAG